MEILQVKDFPASADVIHDPEGARRRSNFRDRALVAEPAPDHASIWSPAEISVHTH